MNGSELIGERPGVTVKYRTSWVVGLVYMYYARNENARRELQKQWGLNLAYVQVGKLFDANEFFDKGYIGIIIHDRALGHVRIIPKPGSCLIDDTQDVVTVRDVVTTVLPKGTQMALPMNGA